MKNSIYIIIIMIFILSVNSSYSQIKGKDEPEYNKDTVFVFQSPRPLINPKDFDNIMDMAWGLDFLLSGNGFGFGLFYQKTIIKDFIIFASLYMSGARNTDEFEQYDFNNNTLYIDGKINRLFMFPLTIGLQKYLLANVLHESLKPYLNFGFGPTFIIATPYAKEFFSSFSFADSFTRFGAFVGCGANVGSGTKAMISVNIRYYWIPFGGDGIESVRDHPIKDFGGLFLSMSLGTKF